MRRFLLFGLLLAAPALAQNYNNASMVVVGGSAINNLPTNATNAVPNAPTSAPAPSVTPAPNPLAKVPAVPVNFPDWAVSNAGQNTAGNTNPQPGAPASPVSPANPAAANNSAAPVSPASPAAPESPISKLWPRDTVPIFVKSCVGFHVELAPSCTCVITTLMASMPHDEFLKESADGTVEDDARLIKARQQCIATPERK